MALSDIQPLSWFQQADPRSLSGIQEGTLYEDYLRANPIESGSEGGYGDIPIQLRQMMYDADGNPTPESAYEHAMKSYGYVPYTEANLISEFSRARDNNYQHFNDLQSFLEYRYGPGTQLINDPQHGLVVQAGIPNQAIFPQDVAYPGYSGNSGGGFLDTVFDFVGNAGPAIIPSLLVPGGQFMAFKTGLGSLADYVVKGALQGALGGRDLDQIIQSGLLGGASGEFASAISPTVKDALGSIGITDPTAVRAAVSSVTSGVREAVFGEGDPLASALKTGLNTYLPQVAAELFPAPVEEAKYSPTEQTTADYGQGYPQLAGLDTGTTTDVTAGTTGPIEQPKLQWKRSWREEQGFNDTKDLLEKYAADPSSGVVKLDNGYFVSNNKLVFSPDGQYSAEIGSLPYSSLLSIGQGINAPFPTSQSIFGEGYGVSAGNEFGGFTIISKDNNSLVLKNPQGFTLIAYNNGQQELIDPQQNVIPIEQLLPETRQELEKSISDATGGADKTSSAFAGGYVSGEELPTGGTPSETQETYVDTTTTPSAETRGEPAPVPPTPAEPVLTSETGTYDFGPPLTPSSATTTPAVPGSPTAQDTTYGTAGQAFEPFATPSGPSETTAYAPGTPSNIPGISGVPDTLGIPGVYGEPSGPSVPSGPAQPEETTATMPVPEPMASSDPTPSEGEPVDQPLADSGGISTSSVGRYTTPARRTGTSPISTAYLARGIVGSPEITGSPVFGTEKGKQRKVWNIKSLREALNIA